jgi:hypothetical protein
MKILVDENIPMATVVELRKQGDKETAVKGERSFNCSLGLR